MVIVLFYRLERLMTQFLFSGAITLMNQLRFSAKLMIISVVFALPIGVLAYAYLSQINEQIERLQSAQESLKYFPILFQWQQQYGDFQTYAYRVRAGDGTQADALSQHRVDLSDSVSAISSFPLPLATFIAELDRALTAPTQQVRDVNELSSSYQAADVALERLLQKVADSGGIANDSDINSYYLADLILKRSQALIKTQRQLRVLGNYALSVSTIDSATFDKLSSELDKHLASQQSSEASMNDVMALYPNAHELQAAYVEAKNALTTSVTLVQNEIVEASDVVISREEFDQQLRHNLAISYSFLNRVTEHLQQNLALREQQQDQQRLWIVGFAVLTLVVLAWLFMGFSYSLQRSVATCQRMLRVFSDGDTTARATIYSKDELGDVLRSYNTMAEHIHDMVQSLHAVAADVSQHSEHVSALANETGVASSHQKSQVEHIAAHIDEVSKGAQKQQHNADGVSASVKLSTQHNAQSRQVVSNTISGIDQLGAQLDSTQQVIQSLSLQGKSINDVVSVIKTIAEQTNLLALNAAIEAARAGEQGRGFAVVADEVRTLATRTAQSTKEIEATVQNILHGIAAAVAAIEASAVHANQAKHDTRDIIRAIDEIKMSIEAISVNNIKNLDVAGQQLEQVAKVMVAFEQLKMHSDEMAKRVDRTSGASEALAQISARLRQSIARFKV